VLLHIKADRTISQTSHKLFPLNPFGNIFVNCFLSSFSARWHQYMPRYSP